MTSISAPLGAPSTLAYSSANTASIQTHDDDEDVAVVGDVLMMKRGSIDDGVVEDREEESEDVFINDSKEDLSRDYESDTKLNDELDNPFQVAAQIVKGPVSVSTLVGSTVLLEALVIGRPEPTVRWLKGVYISTDLTLFTFWACVITAIILPQEPQGPFSHPCFFSLLFLFAYSFYVVVLTLVSSSKYLFFKQEKRRPW